MDSLRKVLAYLKPYARSLLLGVAGMGVFTLLSLVPPLLMRQLINGVVAAGAWQLLVPVIALVIAVPVVSQLVNFGNTQIIMRAGYRLISDMRLTMYDKVLRLSMQFHTDHSSGVLVNRLMDDVNMFQYLITGQTVSILVNLTVFVFSVTIVFSISPVLGAILAGVLVLYVFAYRFFSGRIRTATAGYREVYDRISERLQETVSGVRQVRIYNRELWENSTFLDRTSDSLRHALTSRVQSVGLSTACNFIAGFGSAAIAIVGASFVLEKRLQYGDILAVSTYIWMALNPAIALTTLAGQLTEALVSVRRVLEILDTELTIVSPARPERPARREGRVELRDVDFSYVPDVPLFERLSLSVEPGTSVALVGHTGCGKTTLTSLLMRSWDVQGGEVLIDGVDVRKWELRELRRSFGVVLQDPVLFDGTFRENVCYGRPDASDEQVEEACRAAEIWELVRKLPRGLDTLIGTYGVKLSLGEKQRVSIARAILRDPLILIMDEATSALDSESEALIQKALSRVLVGRTSFVVAHRLSTITGADMIVTMDRGRILEIGRHEELLATPGGHYRRLYEELVAAHRKGVRPEEAVEAIRRRDRAVDPASVAAAEAGRGRSP